MITHVTADLLLLLHVGTREVEEIKKVDADRH